MTTEEKVNPEEYNGWTNRETWATALHIDNDFGTYTMRNEWIEEIRSEETDAVRQVSDLAHQLENWLDVVAQNLTDGQPVARELRMMLDEIGSRWRVNYREIAKNWLSES